MKDIFEEAKKLKNVYLQLEDGRWAPTLALKCMETEFVKKKISKYFGIPRSMIFALSYLLKQGYAEIKVTQEGYEFAKAYLESYNQRSKRMSSAAKERRRMRRVALEKPFSLDKIVPCGSSATIFGFYEDVTVEVSSFGHYIKLKSGDVISYLSKGRIYNKVMSDVANALMSPEGKLWVIKVGANRLERFLKWRES
ncbi:hypothetical protein DRO59_07040 [Candidatus Bathyarchaeota archaeon]|nr:MAG: hypothetical protein DRO59_07040 [Candidatus Bathyarchaeota archaeon]